MGKAITLVAMDGSAASTDDDLIRQYCAGEMGAFAQLYSRHRDVLYGYLFRQVNDAAVCDDLFQESWQRVIRSAHTYVPDGRFRPWLLRIAQNQLKDYWRRQKIRPTVTGAAMDRIAFLADPSNPEKELSDFEQSRRVQMELEDLPDEQRTVILLRLEQQLTLEEIAELTGTTRETAKSRLRYAMDKLRAKLLP